MIPSAHHGIGGLAEIGAGAQEAGAAVEQDRLDRAGAAGERGPHLDVVAAAPEVVDRGFGQARVAVIDETGRSTSVTVRIVEKR